MTKIVVIGAGIVGLCTALFLQRAGMKVHVYDQNQPGGGASYGNAGLLSPHACLPIAMPGMVSQVPKWLLDPSGPLALKRQHALRAAPWLLKWLVASRTTPMTNASVALRQLHEFALEHYRSLLGEAHFANLIASRGQIHVWSSGQESAGERLAHSIRENFGVVSEKMSRDQLRALVPAIDPAVQRARFYPNSAHAVNPLRLVRTLAQLFADAGGVFVQEAVTKLVPNAAGGGFRVLTNLSDLVADIVVVAAGAWSNKVLAPLGVKVPLEAERGYHVELSEPSIELPMPIIHQSRAIGATPMEGGLRLAGWVDIGGLDAPPDEKRGAAMLKQGIAMFPGLSFHKSSFWMGFRPGTPDSLPVLGEVRRKPGLFLAFGHGHTGMTAGAITGRLVSQLILREKAVLDPAPFALERF